MELLIRRATPLDARLFPAIERSSGEVFRAVAGLEWIADDSVMSTEEHLEHIGGGGHVWSAVRGEAVVGFLTAENVGAELHIWQMAVHLDEQGHGVGAALLRACCERGRALDLDALTLTTFRDLSWNERFYQKGGFVTLQHCELSPRLRGVLDLEVERGMPRRRRCAMVRPRSPQPQPRQSQPPAQPPESKSTGVGRSARKR